MILEHFKRKRYKPAKYVTIKPDCLAKCPKCQAMVFVDDLKGKFKICPACGKYLKMSSKERLDTIVDEGSFVEYFREINTKDPLKFPDYRDKQESMRRKSGLDEAIVTGTASIDGMMVVIGVMDTNYMMGSMGSVVGEKITKSVELAIKKSLPLIIFSASGGARMQEGMFSLMQMAKTSQAIAKLKEKGLLYISVMTDPTTGGVSASFASLGDIIIGEKGALIGFAGPRVIKQVTGTDLPEGFQRSEFLLAHGMLDMVVARENMREVLIDILSIHLHDNRQMGGGDFA